MRLENRVVIITGGARGIGKATAQVFAAEGARLALWDVDSRAGEEAVGAVSAAGGRAQFYKVDVTDAAQVAAGMDAVERDLGPIDVLINNAGILRDASLLKMKDEDFDAVIGVNLKGVFLCGREAARRMSARNRGVILNASSVVALHGNFGQSNYVATKAGVIGMTQTWARELGRKGIRVNAVAPGFIATEMVGTIPPEVLEKTLSRVPMARMGLPEEVARVYLFLASDDASYVNGATISVDGGF